MAANRNKSRQPPRRHDRRIYSCTQERPSERHRIETYFTVQLEKKWQKIMHRNAYLYDASYLFFPFFSLATNQPCPACAMLMTPMVVGKFIWSSPRFSSSSVESSTMVWFILMDWIRGILFFNGTTALFNGIILRNDIVMRNICKRCYFEIFHSTSIVR